MYCQTAHLIHDPESNSHPPPDAASGFDFDYADGDGDDGDAHYHAHGDAHENVDHYPSVYLPESYPR